MASLTLLSLAALCHSLRSRRLQYWRQDAWDDFSAGYEEFAGKLAAALREAIETDLSDAEERQVSPDIA